jgi:hypothetical protein
VVVTVKTVACAAGAGTSVANAARRSVRRILRGTAAKC